MYKQRGGMEYYIDSNGFLYKSKPMGRTQYMVEDNTISEQRDSKGRFVKGHGIGHRFQLGESGNPGGKPKDLGITAMQIEMLDKLCPYDNHSPQRTWRQWLAEKGLILAAEKEAALKDLKDRLEGKVLDTHKIEGDVPVSIIYKQLEGKDKTGGS